MAGGYCCSTINYHLEMSDSQQQDNRGWEEKFYSIKDDLIEHAEDYSRYESGYYWNDKNHYGLLLVSSKAIDKFSLSVNSCDKIELWIDSCDLNEIDQAAFLKKYDFVVYLHHAEAYSITKGGSDFSGGHYTKTPHGECYSPEFVAWFNEFPVDLLQEGDDHLKVIQWCHG